MHIPGIPWHSGAYWIPNKSSDCRQSILVILLMLIVMLLDVSLSMKQLIIDEYDKKP